MLNLVFWDAYIHYACSSHSFCSQPDTYIHHIYHLSLIQKQANSWNFYLLTIATLFSSVSLAFSHLSEPGWAVEQAEGEWDVCTLVFLNHLFESLLGCFCVSATAVLWLEFMLLSCTLFQQSLQNIKWCFSLCCINSSACLCILSMLECMHVLPGTCECREPMRHFWF